MKYNLDPMSTEIMLAHQPREPSNPYTMLHSNLLAENWRRENRSKNKGPWDMHCKTETK